MTIYEEYLTGVLTQNTGARRKEPYMLNYLHRAIFIVIVLSGAIRLNFYTLNVIMISILLT